MFQDKQGHGLQYERHKKSPLSVLLYWLVVMKCSVDLRALSASNPWGHPLFFYHHFTLHLSCSLHCHFLFVVPPHLAYLLYKTAAISSRMLFDAPSFLTCLKAARVCTSSERATDMAGGTDNINR